MIWEQFAGKNRTAVVRALIGVTIAGAGIGASTPAQAAPDEIETPSRFKANFERDISTVSGDLWFGTISSNLDGRGKVGEFMRRRPGGWSRIPLLKDVRGESARLAVAESDDGDGATPCLSDANPGDSATLSRLRCYERGRWETKRIDPALRGMKLDGLEADGSEVTALFRNWIAGPSYHGSKRPRLAIAKISGHRVVQTGRTLVVGRPFEASLGQSTDDAPRVTADVLYQLSTGKARGGRTLATLEGGRWTRSALPETPPGVSQAGPVRTADGVYAPVQDPWRGMSVFRRSGEGAWTRVAGEASDPSQTLTIGSLQPLGDELWLATSAAAPNGSSMYQYGTRIDRPGDRFEPWHLLDRGRTSWDGNNEVAQFQGKPVFLYAKRIGRQFKAVLNFTVAN